jgi:hypothetical protein
MRDRSRVESAPTDVRSAAELARARRSKTDGWGWRTRLSSVKVQAGAQDSLKVVLSYT